MGISAHSDRAPRGADMQLLGEVKTLTEGTVLRTCEASPSAMSAQLELGVEIEPIPWKTT